MENNMKEQIENLLQQMTLEEKVSMTAGSDMWHSTGIPRLGIPPIKVTVKLPATVLFAQVI